jgi:Ca-activated chloride channel family protein
LLAIPLLVAVYVWLLLRARKAALRFAHLSLVKEAMSQSGRWRRHIPPVLFLIALTAMLLAVARPSGTLTLPSQRQTLILAMDVSGSMRARDVQPSRIEAAQAAVRAFINDLPKNTRIGIVSFAATASVVLAPTENREDMLAAVERFQLQRATAVGSGIIVSLATLFPDANIDVSSLIYGGQAPRSLSPKGEKKADKGDKGARGDKPKPVPPGSYQSAAIILLTDGQRTMGPDPIEAAKMAADMGVRIFTVGIGTTSGDVIGFEGWSFRVRLDEESLKQIANLTRGEYFYAGTATDLKKVYETLGTRLVLEKKHTEVTAIVAAVGAALAFLAGLLSLLWFNRIL